MLSFSSKLGASSLRRLTSIKTSNFTHPVSSIRAFSQAPEQKKVEEPKKLGLIEKIFGYESNFASLNTNRWSVVLPAFLTHISIGSPYAWSLMADTLTKELGFVAPAAADWSMLETAMPLSIIFVVQGLTATIFGKWQNKVGLRKALAFSSLCFGAGFLMTSYAISIHNLPLLYLGYGILGGTGIGVAYTPPVQALIKWFPDKKGMASGLAIAGFGSGALAFTPITQYLTKKFMKLPDYLGPANNFITQTIDGKLYAETFENGVQKWVEVINATSSELSKLDYTGLQEGLYAVGTGNTGAAEAIGVLGLGYFTLMMASCLCMKLPHPNFVPEGLATPAAPTTTTTTTTTAVTPAETPNLDAVQASKTKQFHLLGANFVAFSMGGMGLFGVAKPMMSEVFSNAMPEIVTAAFASKFILALAAGNLSGRLIWSNFSDRFGRRITFSLISAACIPIYWVMPSLVEAVIETKSALPLYAFGASASFAISCMGGVYAMLPAYEADLFGAKDVGAIHGRMLLYSSVASLFGPLLVLKLRNISEANAYADLLTKVDPTKFQDAYGVSIDKANELIQAKSLSLNKLLVLANESNTTGVPIPDPSPYLYNSTLYSLSAFMGLAALAHHFVRPLTPAQLAASGAPPVEAEFVEKDMTNFEITGSREVKKNK